ncbi:MAG: hypothetical protein MJ248_07080 [Bacilli bacterium]|nr:hypothetical protein [Bacilli bacterium]
MRKEKIRETDFDASRELPSNRRSQFFDLFKHRFLDLFKLTLLLDLFILPLFAVYLLFSILISGSDPTLTYTLYFYMSLAFIPCVWILYVGLGGIVEPLKQMIWGEGESNPSMFFKGIKRNIKASLIGGFIESISIFGVMFGTIYLLTHAPESKNNWIMGVGIGLLAAQAIIITMITFFLVMQNTTFENTVFGMLRNSFIFSLARLPINLLFIIIFPGVSVALFIIPTTITPYIGIALTLLFNGIGLLIWALNSISLFDIYINENQNPDYYHKGLAKETKED